MRGAAASPNRKVALRVTDAATHTAAVVLWKSAVLNSSLRKHTSLHANRPDFASEPAPKSRRAFAPRADEASMAQAEEVDMLVAAPAPSHC